MITKTATIPYCAFSQKHKDYIKRGLQCRMSVAEGSIRAGKTIDKLYILDGCQDGPISTIKREAKKTDALIKYVENEYSRITLNEVAYDGSYLILGYNSKDLFSNSEKFNFYF